MKYLFILFGIVSCGSETCDFYLDQGFCVKTNQFDVKESEVQTVVDITFKHFYLKHPEFSQSLAIQKIKKSQDSDQQIKIVFVNQSVFDNPELLGDSNGVRARISFDEYKESCRTYTIINHEVLHLLQVINNLPLADPFNGHSNYELFMIDPNESICQKINSAEYLINLEQSSLFCADLRKMFEYPLPCN